MKWKKRWHRVNIKVNSWNQNTMTSADVQANNMVKYIYRTLILVPEIRRKLQLSVCSKGELFREEENEVQT